MPKAASRHLPRTKFSYTPRSALASHKHASVDSALKSLRSCARQLTPLEYSLSDELRILERLYYKSVNQHRSALFFQKIKEVRRLGNRIQEVNIGRLTEDLRYTFYIGEGLERNPKMLKGAWIQIPEGKFVNILYGRISDITALLTRARERFAKAYQSLLLMLQTGAFLHLILTFISIVARLDVITVELGSAIEILKETLYGLLEAIGEKPEKGKMTRSNLLLENLPLKDLPRPENDASMYALLDEDLGSTLVRRDPLSSGTMEAPDDMLGIEEDPFHMQEENRVESLIISKVVTTQNEVQDDTEPKTTCSKGNSAKSSQNTLKEKKRKKKKRDAIDDIFGSL